MTQDEIKALIEDLRLNHEYCPQEVILQAADQLERMQVRILRPPKREWVGLTDEEFEEVIKELGKDPRILAVEIEIRLMEKNT
jgi:hypothetical protein